MVTQAPLRICDLLVPEHIMVRPAQEDRAGVIGGLLSRMVESGALAADRLDAAMQAIAAREARGSTAIGGGLAIPHARLSFVHEVSMAFALLGEGHDFHPIDASPVRYVLLMLSPESQPATHLHALTTVPRFFRDSLFLRQLDACRTGIAIHDAFVLMQARH
mgnify:FL=1